MTGSNLEPRQAWQVVAFLRSLLQEHRDILPSVGQVANISPITNSRLRSAGDDGANWLTYSGSYNGRHYSRLDHIDRDTVAGMRSTWLYQFDSGDEPVEAIPLVVDGVMYLPEPPRNVIALSATDEKLLWKYGHDHPRQLALCCFRTEPGPRRVGQKRLHGNP